MYFTHWILALIDSLVALVKRCPQERDHVLEPRFEHPRPSIIGCSRLLTAQLCHQRKCFLAGRVLVSNHSPALVSYSPSETLLIDAHLANQFRFAPLKSPLHRPLQAALDFEPTELL